jgi:hypothetical protein
VAEYRQEADMNANLPVIGAPVVTSDGHLLGKVSAVTDDCFKVDKPMAADEWLGLDIVSSVDRDVRLSLTRNQLEGRPEGIEHFGFHVHREN